LRFDPADERLESFGIVALRWKLSQRNSAVERLAVNGKWAFLTCIRNALYIGKFQTLYDPIYQRQYQIQYQMACGEPIA
jgi:hypothetical protein